MKLSKNIYVVASGSSGFALTHDLDCNVYLIDCGNSLALIDCGVGLMPYKILDNIKNLGFDKNNITDIFITHAHVDHCGGAEFLKKHTGATVHAYGRVSTAVSSADTAFMSLDKAKEAGYYPDDYLLKPCAVSSIDINDPIKVGSIEFETILTPGHSADHCTFYAEIDSMKVLFAGDSFFPGGAIALQPIWDCSITDYADSAKSLSKLSIDALLPSHHQIIMSGGQEVIKNISDTFSKLSIPPQA